ncbi:MAG: RNA-binding protein [Clostridia bacterium]|nr:RNA-binding protein [Clostridia bacterium]
MQSDLQIGSVVKSLKGRDAGESLVVIGFQGNRVLTVNGRTRKTNKPKLKNKKHLLMGNEGIILEIPIKLAKGEKLGNQTVKKLIAEKLKQEE